MKNKKALWAVVGFWVDKYGSVVSFENDKTFYTRKEAESYYNSVRGNVQGNEGYSLEKLHLEYGYVVYVETIRHTRIRKEK